MKRMSNIIENEKCKKHILHFNNFFTGYSLLVNLSVRNLTEIGKVWSNGTESCSLGETKKDKRASYL